MEWLLDALRVVREVRDWTGTRRRADARADETRRALEDAARDLESFATAEGLDVPPAARVEKADREERLVDPLGPEDPRAAQGDDLADDGAVKTSDDRVRVEDIDPQAVSAIKRLRRYGYKGYLVGGCVRDLLLSISPKDFDIATDARPEEVKSVFRNSRIIGRRFRLVHLYYRGGKVLEVATFRAAITSEEEEEGRGDLLIRRDNVFGTEQEDAQRRDFTINALFYDPERGEIIDHVGGLDDIDAKVVRMIGDPDVRLREDPVRILRAIRFRAKAELTIEPSLEAALSRHVEELVRCPPARLLEETLKLLRMGHAARSFEEMMSHEVIKVLLPELDAFLSGHFSMLAGSPVMEERDPLEEVKAHLRALDDVVAQGPVTDDIVFGALLYPLADAVMEDADAEGRDRNRRLAELLAEIGGRIQLTRKMSETLRQCWGVQRHFAAETLGGGRRRRRMSPGTLVRRSFFQPALTLYEIHLRATGAPLDDVETWRDRAQQEGVFSDREDGGSDEDGPRRKKRRGGRRRRRATSSP